MTFPSRTNRRLIKLLLSAFVVHGVALAADCAAPLAALTKSWQQARLAHYDVESPEQPLPSKPAMVRIGKTIWTESGLSGFLRDENGPSENPMATDIKRQTAKGGANCELVGNGTYRGQSIVKYKLDPAAGSNSTGRVTLWVSKTSGLPVFHEYEKLPHGGYAWVYGDAVKEPAGK